MHRFTNILLSLFLSIALLLPLVKASEQAEVEAWLDDDTEFRSLEVNEGKLSFIEAIADRKTLHSDSELIISDSSLTTGWVNFRQCYFNINPVAATDIVYQYKKIRNLKITSTKNIGEVQTDEQLLQLYDIKAEASVCVSAEINVIEKSGNGYVINNGPYHLRFLDGYYPYHVTLSIIYPAELISVSEITPPPQPLFNVQTDAGQLTIDTWFVGVLTMQVYFENITANGGG